MHTGLTKKLILQTIFAACLFTSGCNQPGKINVQEVMGDQRPPAIINLTDTALKPVFDDPQARVLVVPIYGGGFWGGAIVGAIGHVLMEAEAANKRRELREEADRLFTPIKNSLCGNDFSALWDIAFTSWAWSREHFASTSIGTYNEETVLEQVQKLLDQGHPNVVVLQPKTLVMPTYDGMMLTVNIITYSIDKRGMAKLSSQMECSFVEQFNLEADNVDDAAAELAQANLITHSFSIGEPEVFDLMEYALTPANDSKSMGSILAGDYSGQLLAKRPNGIVWIKMSLDRYYAFRNVGSQ